MGILWPILLRLEGSFIFCSNRMGRVETSIPKTCFSGFECYCPCNLGRIRLDHDAPSWQQLAMGWHGFFLFLYLDVDHKLRQLASSTTLRKLIWEDDINMVEEMSVWWFHIIAPKTQHEFLWDSFGVYRNFWALLSHVAFVPCCRPLRQRPDWGFHWQASGMIP